MCGNKVCGDHVEAFFGCCYICEHMVKRRIPGNIINIRDAMQAACWADFREWQCAAKQQPGHRIVIPNLVSDPDSDVQLSLKIDDILLIQAWHTVGQIDGRADRRVYGRNMAT